MISEVLTVPSTMMDPFAGPVPRPHARTSSHQVANRPVHSGGRSLLRVADCDDDVSRCKSGPRNRLLGRWLSGRLVRLESSGDPATSQGSRRYRYRKYRESANKVRTAIQAFQHIFFLSSSLFDLDADSASDPGYLIPHFFTSNTYQGPTPQPTLTSPPLHPLGIPWTTCPDPTA